MKKLEFLNVTFDQQLEAAWNFHNIEKAVFEKKVADLRAENERLRLALHDIYEVYAGSEGIPEPVTCPEAYLLSLLQQMVEIAAEHKK